MSFPESVLDVVKDCVSKNLNDIDKAVRAAERRIKKLPEYKDLQDQLLHEVIRHLIHDAIHSNNVRLKRESGGYNNVPKALVGRSDIFAVYRISREVWMMRYRTS